MILLFGSTFSGGTSELLLSKYSEFYYYAPDSNTDYLKKLSTLKYKHERLSIFQRLYKTIKFLNKSKPIVNEIYITHSLQAIFLPIFFPKIKFIWIAQGIEVFVDNISFFIFKTFFFNYISTLRNIKISVVNPLLLNFFKKNLSNVDVFLDPYIRIQVNSPKNYKELNHNNKTFFVLLRNEKCKNSNLAVKLINKSKSLNITWIIVDMTNNISESINNKNCSIYKGPVEKEYLLNLLSKCDFLLYTSYFEGFGLLINEAISIGVKPVIGYLSLFASHPFVVCVESYNESKWLKIISSL